MFCLYHIYEGFIGYITANERVSHPALRTSGGPARRHHVLGSSLRSHLKAKKMELLRLRERNSRKTKLMSLKQMHEQEMLEGLQRDVN
jgi:hypothetical protein